MAFEIITLEQLIKRLESYNHKELHVHHTWRPNHKIYADKPDGIYWQKAMKDFHVNTNKWNDIAQHVTLLPDGLFVTGRDFAKTPASIAGYNSGAFCVEMIGDFDIGMDKFDGKQKASMIGLAKWFDNRKKYIRFHRENSPKTCPGSGIDKTVFMNEVRGIVPQPTPQQPISRDEIDRKKPTLRQGDNGEFVVLLQDKLNSLGFNVGKADGVFGKKTYDAVVLFQKTHKLTADGIVGANSWRALDSIKTGIVNVSSSLNVRSGAGSNFPVVGSLKANEKVIIFEEKDGWYRIEISNRWVSKQYIKII